MPDMPTSHRTLRHASRFAWLAWVLCGALALWGPAGAQDLKIGYADEELRPFAMGNGQQRPNPPGIYIDLINQIASELGITVSYQRQPTKRAQHLLKTGELDSYFSLSSRQARLDLGHFPMHNGAPDASKRIGAIAYHLYKLDKSRVDYDGTTIKNVGGPIGVNLGYSIADDIRKMGLAVEEVKSTEANLKKLQLGRIAAFAGQDVDTDVWLEHKDYANIVKLPLPLASKDYFLLFSKQYLAVHPDTAHKFWTRLGEIRDETVKKLAPMYR